MPHMSVPSMKRLCSLPSTVFHPFPLMRHPLQGRPFRGHPVSALHVSLNRTSPPAPFISVCQSPRQPH